MALSAGSCIRVTSQSGSTVFILLNDPFGEARGGIFVPMEHYDTFRADDTVCVARGHEWIRTKMFADYGGLEVWSVSEIERQIDAKDRVAIHPREPNCSDELLEQLRYGLFQSQDSQAKFKSYACRIWGEKYEEAPDQEEEEDEEEQWYRHG